MRGSRLDHMRWRPQTFYRHDLSYSIGEHAGVLQHDAAAQRMSDEGDRITGDRVHELAQIEHVVYHRLAAADRPIRTAVAAKIRCNYVVVLSKIERDPAPIATVIATAVNQNHKRLVRIAPINVVQLQALGIEIVRRGPDDALGHRRSFLRMWNQ